MELGLVPAARALSIAAAVAASGAVAVTTGAAASPRFPASLYPPAASFPAWGPPTGCASIEGVRPIHGNPLPQLLPLLSHFQRVSELHDLQISDRAEWPQVRSAWRHGHLKPAPAITLRVRDVRSGPARLNPYADLIRTNCGARLLAHSWWIAVCPTGQPRTACDPGLTGHFLFLNRRGHWLLWWTN
ncbi:MAG TPA: hypothetical protein VFJ93_00770 [Gaiellaceae bacterium]|nr:hypothetical protein [Gaiellaceae bacterium]